jgi:hypothetical protein
MPNHPNRSRVHFTVRYGREIAKFSSNRDAMAFAAAKSAEPAFRGWLIEVGHKTGLVGQYRDGKTTAEFQAHHDCASNG